MKSARRVAALASTLPLFVVVGCGSGEYDEQAHRAAYEARLGHEVADWDAVRATAENLCEADEEQMLANVAVMADEGQLEYLDVDVQHLCPGRAEDLASAKRQVEDLTGEPL